MRARLLLLALLPACAAAPAAEPVGSAAAATQPAPESACGQPARFLELAGKPSDRAQRIALAQRYMASCATDEIVALTRELVAYPTVSAQEEATGAAFQAMADRLQRYAKDNGLDFRRHGPNDAWEVMLGQGEASVAFVMHADVVPVAEDSKTSSAALPPGWSRPPFEAQVADGRLYGRGTEDDKGPIAAALVTLRVLGAFGLTPNGKIMAVMGTGEEHDWTGMGRYVKETKKPRFVVSLDANYPVVLAESGFVAWELSAPLGPVARSKPRACAVVGELKGGQFLTQVPGEASVMLHSGGKEKPEQLLVRAQQLTAELTRARPELSLEVRLEGGGVKLLSKGAAVHSSVAEDGKNALWGMAVAATKLGLCEGGAQVMLEVLARYFDGDHYGERLGLAYQDPLMGKLLVIPTVLRVDKGAVALGVNMRRPQGKSKEQFEQSLAAALAKMQKEVSATIKESPERYVGDPAIADLQGPMVPALMAIYRRHTKDEKSQPISVRGGTYARLFPGAVSFGPSLPGRPYRGHAPDEWIDLDALRLTGMMVLDAALELDALSAGPAAAPGAAR